MVLRLLLLVALLGAAAAVCVLVFCAVMGADALPLTETVFACVALFINKPDFTRRLSTKPMRSTASATRGHAPFALMHELMNCCTNSLC